MVIFRRNLKNRAILYLPARTLHPDRLLRPAVVSPWALGGEDVARGRLEPVPALGEVSVAERGGRRVQVRVERPPHLVGQHRVPVRRARVLLQHDGGGRGGRRRGFVLQAGK